MDSLLDGLPLALTTGPLELQVPCLEHIPLQRSASLIRAWECAWTTKLAWHMSRPRPLEQSYSSSWNEIVTM